MELNDEYYANIGKEFTRLVQIIYRLRQPDGCPWDRAQTHKSIRENVIEEAYELVEAIDLDNPAKMREECGDVMLQSIFNAVMSEEAGEFSVADMIKELNNKLVFRHTHIFGGDKAGNADEALSFWEKAKMKEKGQHDICDKLDSVPVTFTAVMRAAKVQKAAKKLWGFDFASADDAIEKMDEERDEVKQAHIHNDEAAVAEECGDLLFAAVNVVRMLGVDPEIALLESSKKFEQRLRKMNELAKADGVDIAALSLDDKEVYYQKAKAALK